MAITAGNEFLVNAYTADAGGNVSVAGHFDGSFLVTWVAASPPVSQGEYSFDPYQDIIGRAFDDGAPLGGDFRVNTEQHDGQFNPQVAARPDGSYVVAYSSGEENNLPGTYAASQIVGNTGSLIGPERLGDYSNVHSFLDVAVASDGQYVVTSSGEDYGEAQYHAADGTIVDVWPLGNTSSSTAVSTSSLGGNDFLMVWQGNDVENPYDTPWGLYAEGPRAPFLVGLPTTDADPTIRPLPNGMLALLYRDDGGYVLSLVDPVARTATPASPVAGSGTTDSAELAVLDTGNIVVTWTGNSNGDGSGTAIEARIFNSDGAPLTDVFLVNQVIEGDQARPSVAGIGDGQFVISWDSPDGVKARIFDSDGVTSPTSPLFARADTIDLSPPENQQVVGVAGGNSFYVDLAATSGQDRIANFGKQDVLLTTAKLFDGNGDGIVTFGRNQGLDLDGPGTDTDTIGFASGVAALRYVGKSEGLSVYADAATRPRGAIEGTLAAETLRGDAAGTKAEMFFLDTALGTSLGDDRIEKFGASDILVTTTKILDGNNDGIINFGADKLLDLGPNAIAMVDTSGAAAKALEFDGTVAHRGETYYVYSLVGSAAGMADLQF